MMSAPASRYALWISRTITFGPGEHQQVVVAFQVVRMIVQEARAAEVRLRQLVLLDHRAHRAIHDEDALVFLMF